jgi:plastocyanin
MTKLKTLIALVLSCLAIAGCGGTDDNNSNAQEGPLSTVVHEVEMMEGNQFSPDRIEIRAGETVKWVNSADEHHTATGRDFDSGEVMPGESYSHTFTQTETVTYRCRFHAGMTGTIVVQ